MSLGISSRPIIFEIKSTMRFRESAKVTPPVIPKIIPAMPILKPWKRKTAKIKFLIFENADAIFLDIGNHDIYK